MITVENHHPDQNQHHRNQDQDLETEKEIQDDPKKTKDPETDPDLAQKIDLDQETDLDPVTEIDLEIEDEKEDDLDLGLEIEGKDLGQMIDQEIEEGDLDLEQRIVVDIGMIDRNRSLVLVWVFLEWTLKSQNTNFTKFSTNMETLTRLF